MEEHFFELKNPESETIVVILDTSESTKDVWEEIVCLTKKIFQKIPADIPKKLFFLGNPQECDFSTFEKNPGLWQKNNLKKGSFISPILSHIADAKIIVIGSGIIYDLEDWADGDVAKKIIFVQMHESMRGSIELGEEIDGDAFNRRLSNLHNRVHLIKIHGGSDFIPFYWDNPGYTLCSGESCELKAANLKDYSIRIASFGKNVLATLEKTEGNEEVTLKLIETTTPDVITLIENNGSKWQKLTDYEVNLFNQHKTSQRIFCPEPKCGKEITHSLKCENHNIHPGFTGYPIYQSLKNITGFVIFKETIDGVLFKEYKSEIIKIGENRVARNLKTRAEILYNTRYTNKRDTGREFLKPYHPLKEGYYVSII